ncbi:hypothetical protein LTR56_003739 [Elasticomyces elasticus]|nr:hypothetical protein LTR22_014623 [Elasticomyces elasticus]KAK3654881.1 hypothetical protein LTR56_003739 [Elasticomyces elasticus]KAK4928790.1 hypothetical protein LTR49_004599 [Elasticomyces elasticus]KAK5766584.1 hypothetical protein LTS12_003203 [Elasticomyces elasticus]
MSTHRRNPSTTTTTKPPPPSPSISLLLTTAHLLDLSLLPNWPAITPLTLTPHSDARLRIRSTEFLLYHFFHLYSPPLTAEKLTPFYPPLEPLQSLNLRAALFRCLTELKKNGVLPKEIVLRKSMLDDCCDGKFWEVCAAFSGVVLRKVVRERKLTFRRLRQGGPVAERLGVKGGLGKGEEGLVEGLVVAHRVGLKGLVAERREKRDKFRVVWDVLEGKARELEGRRAGVEGRGRVEVSKARREELEGVERGVRKGWIGDTGLRDVLLGARSTSGDAVLDLPLDKLAKAAGDATPTTNAGVLSTLSQTAHHQTQRVRRWQNMHDQLSAAKSAFTQQQQQSNTSSSSQPETTHLRFDKHRSLNLRDAPPPPPSQTKEQQPRQRSETIQTLVIGGKYDDILTSMREELRLRRRATAPSPSPAKHAVLPHRKADTRRNPSIHLDTLAGASHDRSPSRAATMSKRPSVNRRLSSRSSSSQNRAYHAPKVDGQRQPIPLKSEIFSPLKGSWTSLGSLVGTPVEELEIDLTANIPAKDEDKRASGSSASNSAIDSGLGTMAQESESGDGESGSRKGSGTSEDSEASVIVAMPESGFKVPALPSAAKKATDDSTPRLSLAERTRMSMALRSTSDEEIRGVLPEPQSANSLPPPNVENTASRQDNDTAPQHQDRRKTLAERTRESISLAPPPASTAPSKPTHSRTRSSLYPINQFETPMKIRRSSTMIAEEGRSPRDGSAVQERRRDITPREQLFSPEAEYDSVFRPRPKIRGSPVSSSPRLGGGGGEMTGEMGRGEEVVG